MNLDPNASYNLTRAGASYGPYTGSQLLTMARSQQVQPTDTVWTAGMADWLTLNSFVEFQGIFPQATQPQTTAVQTQPQPRVVRSSPSRKLVTRTKTRTEARKGASFALLLFSFISIFIALPLIFIGVIIAINAFGDPIEGVGIQATTTEAQQQVADIQEKLREIASSLNLDPDNVSTGILTFFPLLILAVIFWPVYLQAVYVYRGWKYIQDVPTVNMGPVAAVFLFLCPIVNLVGFFIVYCGWAGHYNTKKSLSTSVSYPNVSQGFFIAACVVTLVFLPILMPFMHYQMCRGINHLAIAPDVVA